MRCCDSPLTLIKTSSIRYVSIIRRRKRGTVFLKGSATFCKIVQKIASDYVMEKSFEEGEDRYFDLLWHL